MRTRKRVACITFLNGARSRLGTPLLRVANFAHWRRRHRPTSHTHQLLRRIVLSRAEVSEPRTN